jgi:hypothetical protein
VFPFSERSSSDVPYFETIIFNFFVDSSYHLLLLSFCLLSCSFCFTLNTKESIYKLFVVVLGHNIKIAQGVGGEAWGKEPFGETKM